jgi:phosphatidylserine/phosphatidylglycerophosphate/cardiolipin synthase-like enzyme
LPKFNQIILTSPNSLYNTLKGELLELTKSAKKSISFSTFQLSNNTLVIKEIIKKAKNNIKVTLYCRPNEILFNKQLKELLDVNITIYFHPLIHAKSILVDSEKGMIFTANFTEKGLDTGLEVGISLNAEQVNDLSIIHKKWENDFPYKSQREISVQKTDRIFKFLNKELIEKKITTKTNRLNQKITVVSDLLNFFDKKVENEQFVKLIQLELNAEFNSMQSKNLTSKPFEIIEEQKRKGKMSKYVLINENFKVENISDLDNFKDLKIYSRHETISTKR